MEEKRREEIRQVVETSETHARGRDFEAVVNIPAAEVKDLLNTVSRIEGATRDEMKATGRPVPLDPHVGWGRTVCFAWGQPLRMERGGIHYEVERVPRGWPNPEGEQ